MDYRRFAAETTTEFLREQAEIIRRLAPGQIVTHDFSGVRNDLDYEGMEKILDVVSFNNYPVGFSWERNDGLNHDFFFGLKRRNFWVMEQQSGPTGWEVMSGTPDPGLLRAWAWESIAHGADLVSFFRWRSCLFGTEQFWHGKLDHHGEPGRRYKEIAGFGQEVKRLAGIIERTVPRRRVAIVSSSEQNWAFDIQPQTVNDGLSWWRQVGILRNGLQSLGVEADIIPEDTDWGDYRLLLFPGWYLVTSEFVKKVEEYVRQGGAVVFNPRTGVKDINNNCLPRTLPGLLSPLLGIEIEEYDCLGGKVENSVRLTGGKEFSNNTWADIIKPVRAEVLGKHGKRFYAGWAAVTVNRYGKGNAYYLGCLPEEGFYPVFFRSVLKRLQIAFHPDLPPGIRVCTREGEGYIIRFIMNLSGEKKRLFWDFSSGAEILLGVGSVPKSGGGTIPGEKELELPPNEVVIIKEKIRGESD